MTEALQIKIPADLLPRDGRFGSGPSKVRPEAVEALARVGGTYLGTSHRQATVKNVVARMRSGLKELFSLPEGYEVIFGNGGATYFWDMATFSLISQKSQHLSFGEFSSKFAAAAEAAPHVRDVQVIKAPVGSHPLAETDASVDLYALTHNETSTGVSMEIMRPKGASGVVAVDATSAAGGLRVDPSQFDVYYFSPQKCFASEGGLWLALVSPGAIERIQTISSSDRWIPASMDLAIALENSLLDQTYNTPSLATIHLTVSQLEWMLDNGGLNFATSRSDRSAEILYGWAEKSSYATPFVTDEQMRSHVIATIDIADEIDSTLITKVLRANGVLDTEPYRKLGRNQLRVAMFPAIDPEDIEALTACVDYVVQEIT